MKILNKLTIKHLMMNKKRTIVTIIGVILSTALMVGIGLIISSFRETLIKDAKMYNGSQHVIFRNVDISKDKIIVDNVNVKNYIKVSYIDSYINDEISYDIYNIDVKNLEKFNYEGVLPNNKNEVLVPKRLGLNIDDYIEVSNTKYKVVGIIKDKGSSDLPNYFIEDLYTIDNITSNSNYLVTFKNIKKSYENIMDIASNLSLDIEDIDINISLLALYGVVKYDNMMNTITYIMIIILSLISIGCIIVIYNSFAISVMERKKQFGLFSSIGTTKTQLIKTVYFEALIISLIGIPLGILSAYLGIGVVIKITNSLLNLGTGILSLTTYPLFILIPIIFMIITILLSAFIPSLKASKISPIEAIRLNDDIKIKSKKIKTHKFIKKIFGIEGELALKNIKRNKKKYRVTIISLFISIVLFVSFSSFIEYIIGGVKNLTTVPDVDIFVSGNIDSKTKQKIINNENVTEYLDTTLISLQYDVDKTAKAYVVSDEYYNKLLKKIGKNESLPIVPNTYKDYEYGNKKRVVRLKNKFDKKETIKLCYEDICDIEFKDYYLVSDFDNLLDSFSSYEVYVIVTKNMLKDYDKYIKENLLLFKTNNDLELESEIRKELDKDNNEVDVYNVKDAYRLEKNVFTVIKIFVYGFITLVSLIGVTSVINTINTSIALRRKEFAVLRSIGLTKKGFNKMIYFESLFFGLKSLLYALPISCIIVYLIHLSISEVVVFNSLMLPIKQIVIAIFGVFIIVLLTMLYASRKIKKENILEAIREENI